MSLPKTRTTGHIYAPVADDNGNVVSLKVGRYDGYKVKTKHGSLFIADTAKKKYNKSQRLYTVSDYDTGVRLDYWQPTIEHAISRGIAALEKHGENLAAMRHHSQRLIATLPIEKIN